MVVGPVHRMAAALAGFAEGFHGRRGACISKAPLNSMSLQNCANAIMRPVAVAVRDPVVLKRITDYLLYGAPGPDGQAGTADDLGNPLAEMKARLDLPKRE